jgi:hypothetical protein
MSGSLSPKSLEAKEEKRIQDVQARINQLRKRVGPLICLAIFVCDEFQKVALQGNHSLPTAPVDVDSAMTPGPPNIAALDPREDSFWTTPGAGKTLQFKNELLINEDVDLGNVTSSFSTPVVPLKSSALRNVPTDPPFQEEGTTDDLVPEDPSVLEGTFDFTTGARSSSVDERTNDRTIGVKYRPSQLSPPSNPPPSSEPGTPVASTGPLTSSSTAENLGHTHSAKKIRLTSDVERIVVCRHKTV